MQRSLYPEEAEPCTDQIVLRVNKIDNSGITDLGMKILSEERQQIYIPEGNIILARVVLTIQEIRITKVNANRKNLQKL